MSKHRIKLGSVVNFRGKANNRHGFIVLKILKVAGKRYFELKNVYGSHFTEPASRFQLDKTHRGNHHHV